MDEKPIAIGADSERKVEQFGVTKGLLHTVAKLVVIILGFDDSDGQVGFKIKDIISPLVLVPHRRATSNHHPTFGQIDFLADLDLNVPTSLGQGWSDELGTDVTFRKSFL